MTPPAQSEQEQRAAVRSAWQTWLLMFVPFFTVTSVASWWFGLNLILPILGALFVAVLLYQRVINKRSWRSIMWGVHAPEE